MKIKWGIEQWVNTHVINYVYFMSINQVTEDDNK